MTSCVWQYLYCIGDESAHARPSDSSAAPEPCFAASVYSERAHPVIELNISIQL